MREASGAISPLVVKVGGSLFTLADLPQRLQSIFDVREPGPVLLLAGGGSPANSIRELSRLHAISEHAAHWLAIRALSLQAHALGILLGDLPVAQTLAECQSRWAEGERLVILDPWPELEQSAPGCLPEGWHVTSDSIAAFLAKQVGGKRLLLLKSVGDENTPFTGEATRNQWVDPYFPVASAGLEVSWFNVRCQPFGNS